MLVPCLATNDCSYADDACTTCKAGHVEEERDRLGNEQCQEGSKVQVLQGVLQQGVSLQLH